MHVGIEHRQIVIDNAHEFEIDQGLVERSVSSPLTNAECRTVNDISASFNRSNVVGDTQSTVLVTVPVHLNFSALITCILNHFLVDEGEEFLDAVGCNVAACITNAETTDTEFHGSVIDHLHIFWV